MTMKNIKIDEKSKFLSAVMLSVVFIGLAFFFGYKKLEDAAAKMEAQNKELETKIASLEQYYLTEEQNKKDTETMTKAIADIFAEYPGDARFEDGIYEAFNLYGASLGSLEFESIGFADPESVKTIPAEIVTAAQIEGYTDEISFYNFDVDYKGSLSYEGLKSMVREISTGNYNLAIGKMNYKITENGMINGEAMLSFYSVRGAGCDYQEPPVSAYDIGLENLFGVNGAVISDMDEEAAED